MVKLGEAGGGLVYRSHGLTTRNVAITRALVVIHGIGRNADHYFASAMAGAFLAGALEDTAVVSQRFASNRGGRCNDKLEEGEISWPCGGWNGGEAPPEAPGAFSYGFTDRVLELLADKDVFPNLKRIVVVGHSAGGQFVHRYLAGTAVPARLRVPVSFVVANPSSYLYLDNNRPFSNDACPAFSTWKYGFDKRVGYTAAIEEKELAARMIAARVTYLLGKLDNFNDGSMDTTCAANAQGPNRLERGKAFHAYINGAHGAKHQLVEIPACGHNARCMFTSDNALPVLFPKE
jgi:pimeloyl-ACP methyl ester carboxylesterase